VDSIEATMRQQRSVPGWIGAVAPGAGVVRQVSGLAER